MRRGLAASLAAMILLIGVLPAAQSTVNGAVGRQPPPASQPVVTIAPSSLSGRAPAAVIEADVLDPDTPASVRAALPGLIKSYACTKWRDSNDCRYWRAANWQAVCLWDIARWENPGLDSEAVNWQGSGAFGLWQIKPVSKLDAWTSEGSPSWRALHPRLDPRGPTAQAAWSIAYAYRRYDSPCGAREARLAKGWW